MSLSPDELNKHASAKPERAESKDSNPASHTNSSAPLPLDAARFLKRINALEKENEALKRKIVSRTRKFRDVIYKLEAYGDVRWCEECDTVYAMDENCQCADEDPCLTDSERNR